MSTRHAITNRLAPAILLLRRIHSLTTVLLLLALVATPGTAQEPLPDLPSEDVTAPPPSDAPTEEIELSATGVRKFRKEQARPINLGASGGNARDVRPADEPGFVICSSGTLGGAVLKNGIPYILSNNHVIAISNAAEKGDPIDQPGLIDNGCRDEAANYVADLSAYKKIRFGENKKNRVDAAIAEIIPGMVDPDGRMQGIGIPGDTIMAPEIGMPVKKAGRSTGVTKGVIELIGVTFIVDFGDEDNPRTARFLKQILVRPNKKTFVESGDSGAVVVYDRKKCPYWVGLLFAGSDDGFGGVNPIKRVFKELKRLKPKGTVTPIGCDSLAVDAAEQAASGAVALEASGIDSGTLGKIERQLRRGERIVDRRDDEMLAIEGVVGLGVGLTEAGREEVALHVLVEDVRPETLQAIPDEIDGMPTRVLKTGRFRAH